MITIKKFRLTEEVDDSETEPEYQLKHAVYNHILESLGILFSDKNPNLIKEGREPAISKSDCIALVTEVLQTINANYVITPRTEAFDDISFIKDWRGFVAITSIKATYGDLIEQVSPSDEIHIYDSSDATHSYDAD